MLSDVVENVAPSVISALTAALPSVISVLTAVIAFVLGKYLWRWYRQPVLELKEGSTRSVAAETVVEDSESVPMVHQIDLANSGSIAAQNCKAEIILNGSNENNVYSIDVPVCWSERNNPARVTVNAGEKTSFDIFAKFREDSDDFIRFPSAGGWPKYSALEVYAKRDVDPDDLGAAVADQGKNREPIDTFPDIAWEESVVRVTAENAVLAEAQITMEWDLQSMGRQDVELQVDQTKGTRRRYLP